MPPHSGLAEGAVATWGACWRLLSGASSQWAPTLPWEPQEGYEEEGWEGEEREEEGYEEGGKG